MSSDLPGLFAASPHRLELGWVAVAGVLAPVLLAALAGASARRRIRAAEAVAEAAAGGKRDRARVQARSRGAAVASLLEALSGQTVCPPPEPPRWLLPIGIGCGLPAAYATARALTSADPVTTVIAAGVAIVSAAVLVLGVRFAAVWTEEGARRVRALALPFVRENATAEAQRKRRAMAEVEE